MNLLKKTLFAAVTALLAAGKMLFFPAPAESALIRGDFLPQSPASAVSETPADCTVQVGDTLWRLAQRYDLPVQALAAENGLSPDTPIFPGQVLHLPKSAAGKNAYTVCPGDTLWHIAQQFHTGLSALLAANPGLSAETLAVGQAILLPENTAPAQPVFQPLSAVKAAVSYAWPLVGAITSPFGNRGEETHHGIDIAGSPGDPVRAAAAGTVEKAQLHDIYGNMILLAHGNGEETLYAHLSRMDVSPGEAVEQGDIIGAVGNTGRSTGPHLHFEIRREQIASDPLPALP